MDWGSRITYLAETPIKGKDVRFGIKDRDRLEHVSVVGRVSADRAGILVHMALQDIERGMGTLVLDAAGYFTELLVERLPEHARDRLIYLDPSDAEFPFSWNALDDFRAVKEDEQALSALVNVLAALYRTPVSPLVEFVAEEMLNRDDASLLLLYELVQDQNRRDELLPKGSQERNDFELCLKDSADSAELVSQHGRYLAKDSLVRNLLGQTNSKFTLSALAGGGIIVVDLSRIRVFPTRITPLVRLFTHAAHACVQNANHPFSLYLFDSVRYLSETDIERMLPERKIAFTLSDGAHLEEDMDSRARTLARSGSVIAFSPGHADAPLLEKIFFPYVGLDDLYKLDAGECAVLLSIDAVRARPFFAHAFPLPDRHNVSLQDVHVTARDRFTLSRHAADQIFARRIQPSVSKQSQGSGDPGSFSSAFRSIFAKGAGTPAPSATPAPAGAPQSAPPPVLKKEKKADAQQSPSEISEDELRQMLHVDPLSS